MAKNKFNPSESVNPETLALHGGDYRSDPTTTAVAVPIIKQLLINLIVQNMLQIYLH